MRLEVIGEVDIDTCGILESAIASHIDAGRWRLVVDLTLCPYVDSTGVACLLRAGTRLGAVGGRFALVPVQPALLRLVRIAKLEDLFEIFSSPTAAVTALSLEQEPSELEKPAETSDDAAAGPAVVTAATSSTSLRTVSVDFAPDQTAVTAATSSSAGLESDGYGEAPLPPTILWNTPTPPEPPDPLAEAATAPDGLNPRHSPDDLDLCR